MFEDRVLKCDDCGSDFTFSASEQEFFEEKGFSNDPKRCSQCRSDRRKQRHNGDGNRRGRKRELHDAICAECGKDTQVPFKPVEDRPVYCRECFSEQRQ